MTLHRRWPRRQNVRPRQRRVAVQIDGDVDLQRPDPVCDLLRGCAAKIEKAVERALDPLAQGAPVVRAIGDPGHLEAAAIVQLKQFRHDISHCVLPKVARQIAEPNALPRSGFVLKPHGCQSGRKRGLQKIAEVEDGVVPLQHRVVGNVVQQQGFDRAFILGDGLDQASLQPVETLPIANLPLRLHKTAERERVVRIERDRPLIARRSLLQPAKGLERAAKALMRVCCIRAQGDGSFEGGRSRVEALEGHEGAAEIVMGRSRARLDLNGLGQKFDRLMSLPLLSADDGERMQGLEVARAVPQHVFDDPFGVLQAPALQVRQCAADPFGV